jgi:putative molybdopterin biosynthesis protein
MSLYLHDIPLPQAQARLEEALRAAGLFGRLGSEEIPLDERAVGRVTAEAVFARLSSPHYHAAAMDGFALRADSTGGALPSRPVELSVAEGQAIYVDTGDPLPDWANAVVPIEQVEALDDPGGIAADPRAPATIRLRASLPPWSHVRPLGEDIVATQLVLAGGQAIRPVDLGVLAASGFDRVRVARRPVVAILPTGSELVPPGQVVRRGDIIEYNSLVLAGQVRTWGGEPVRYPITRDDFDLIQATVQRAADASDLVLINAGSSAGSEDFSARVVESLGELLVHGVAVRPGHPVILGLARRSDGRTVVPVIGVPGYPVSAALTGEIFVEPLLARWLGREPVAAPEVEAVLTRKITSPAGDDDYVRVVVGQVGERLLAAPLTRGAGVITSLARADGITVLGRGVQGLEAGSRVRVRLYRPVSDLYRTLFTTGSHDLTLDVLAQFLAERGRRLVSSNVGSLGGLVAMRRGEAHLAGTHLLDPQTGDYNLAALRQYLPDASVQLVGWVGREQGLLVLPGNPKAIRSLIDLARPDVTLVNRQRGAGTRVLLDYHLQQFGIEPEGVRGYTQEEYTHLALAAAISSGRADTGMGIPAAAQALGLDFIPLFHERYDLVLPCGAQADPLYQPLFDLMGDPAFRRALAKLPGYDLSVMGQVFVGC